MGQDILSDAMALLRTKGHIYGRLELSAPFGLRFPDGAGVCLIATRGSCFLNVGDTPPVPLVAGDFAFMPTRKPVSLRSSAEIAETSAIDRSAMSRFDATRLFTCGGGGLPVSLIGGYFTFSSPENLLLLEHLPPIVHLQGSGPLATPWTHVLLQTIASEVAGEGPGASIIVERLTEVLFIHALRSHCQRACHQAVPGWLGGLSDARIGSALSRIHDDPARAWTVEALAKTVGMSRSAFAARFKALVGKTPMDHLTQWRMVRAASLLREPSPMKLKTIAAAVGYESEGAFRKVFQRVIGTSLSQYRAAVAGERTGEGRRAAR